jgi:hypothetical protein
VVNETDLQAVAQAALDANREKGFQPAPGSLRVSFASEPKLDKVELANADASASGQSASAQTARWNLRIEQVLEASWARDMTVRSIQGRRVVEARRILQTILPLAEAPKIDLYPAWWDWMPFLPTRIVVVSQ